MHEPEITSEQLFRELRLIGDTPTIRLITRRSLFLLGPHELITGPGSPERS